MTDRGQLDGGRWWPLTLFIVVGAIVLALIAVGLVPENPSVSPTVTPSATPTTAPTPTPPLAGETAHVEFRLRSPDPGWKWPTEIQFERLDNGNWTTVRAFEVAEYEPFTVNLTIGTRYRITATDAEGDRRMLANYVPMKRDVSHTVIISPMNAEEW